MALYAQTWKSYRLSLMVCLLCSLGGCLALRAFLNKTKLTCSRSNVTMWWTMPTQRRLHSVGCHKRHGKRKCIKMDQTEKTNSLTYVLRRVSNVGVSRGQSNRQVWLAVRRGQRMRPVRLLWCVPSSVCPVCRSVCLSVCLSSRFHRFTDVLRVNAGRVM